MQSPLNLSRDTALGAFLCRRKLMRTFVSLSLTSCFDRPLEGLNTSARHVASSVAWSISGVILAMLALTPRQLLLFIFIGKAPDTIANQQRHYRTIKQTTTNAAAKQDERAKKSRYDALRYRRKRNPLSKRPASL